MTQTLQDKVREALFITCSLCVVFILLLCESSVAGVGLLVALIAVFTEVHRFLLSCFTLIITTFIISTFRCLIPGAK